ncbi:MAG: hypothetical protein H0W73_21020 [Bacteroidetes bacterium]|nr:hypothetical protein [Bacteroidota bacterium]
MNFRNIILISFIFLVAFVACNKKSKTQNASDNPVPYVQVDMTIYPNDPLYFKIQAIGGWMYVNGGINGLIVYRKSQQEFVALERTSSYLPDNPAAKGKVMPDNFTVRDTISDSRWQMYDGTVSQGPAAWPLRVYGTNYDGNSLRIRN